MINRLINNSSQIEDDEEEEKKGKARKERAVPGFCFTITDAVQGGFMFDAIL